MKGSGCGEWFHMRHVPGVTMGSGAQEMPQFYLSADNASSVRRCNQSRRTRQVITISGLDHLTSRLASFTGIVESVQIDQSATKEKRFLVTMTSEAPAD